MIPLVNQKIRAERELSLHIGMEAARAPDAAQPVWEEVEQRLERHVPEVVRWAVGVMLADGEFRPTLHVSGTSPALLTREQYITFLGRAATEASDRIRPDEAGSEHRARKWLYEEHHKRAE